MTDPGRTGRWTHGLGDRPERRAHLRWARPADARGSRRRHERFGSKRTWIASIAVFAVGSALCATATSAGELIVFRVVQGFGGGMLIPVGFTLVAQSAGPRRVGRPRPQAGCRRLMSDSPTSASWPTTTRSEGSTIGGVSAADLHHRLRVLELERLEALRIGLTDCEPYGRDLAAEIAACRAAHLGAAVTEIASLRADLSGRLIG